MADEHKHDDDPIDQEQYFAKSDNISSLIEQIYQQLVCNILWCYLEYDSKKKKQLFKGQMMFSVYVLSLVDVLILWKKFFP